MNPLPASTVVAVIGAGTMGTGIAQVAAAAGHAVRLHDAVDGAAERGRERIAEALQRAVERGRIPAADAASTLSRVEAVADLTALADVGLAVEVIVEDLAVKQDLFAQLEQVVEDRAILASNTSFLSVTAIASRLSRPERLAGMHFFNPAPAMRLVEVVSGLATDAHVAATVAETARAWGKVAVNVRSTPGFIVNRVARPYYGEALRLLEEGVAGPATLDHLMTACGGFRMGPFALMDLIGNDVNQAVTRSVFEAFAQDPRYRPSLVQQELVSAGWLGRKSGRGFYCYDGSDGPQAALAPRARVSVKEPVRPDGHPFTAGDILVDCTDGRTAAEREKAEGCPVVLHDLALDFRHAGCIAVTASPGVSTQALDTLVARFQSSGLEVVVLPDSPGLVVMRSVAMLVNEAFEAVLHGVADADGVDAAMQHGVNYPRGPVEWGRTVGLGRILAVMEALADVSERVAIDGFLSGWRYRAVDGEPEYFTHYETVSADVLKSDAYRRRVDNPTPLTRRIMSGVFVNCTRTVCERVYRVGDARGAFAAVARFTGPPDVAALTRCISTLAEHEWLLRGELWLAAAGLDDRLSAEQALRGPDEVMSACVLLETADERDARAAAGKGVASLGGVARLGLYRLMCALHRGTMQ